MADTIPCRVCGAASPLFYRDTRDFHRCPRCWLIFTATAAGDEQARAHYTAQWGNQDQKFWRDQTDALLSVIQRYHQPGRILDFGSGSGALTGELARRGCDVTPLEPMIHGYLKDQRYEKQFDTILAIEVLEHLVNLWEEIAELERVLAPGGLIIASTLLTNPFIDQPDAVNQFAAWWYKDDPTHVNFFCNRTLETMASIRGWDVDVAGNKLVVIRKALDR
ncbi:MAG: class I SAM-dependent methyltransferase [Nitrospinae bacterium]|nr:class I SAM-dependent methyltransferase [Nitrospinota bacterium]